jgi:hypothetical protein
MKALRKIEDVKSGSVTFDLPADFNAKKVETIHKFAASLLQKSEDMPEEFARVSTRTSGKSYD